MRLCERGLRVANKHRPDATEVFLDDSLNGDFPQEVLPRSSWWRLEMDQDDPELGEKVLVVHLVKAQDRSWPRPFNEGRPKSAAELSSDWVTLKPGRHGESSEDVDVGIRPEELVQDFTVAQTEELVTLRLLLNQAKLDEVKQHVPMSRLWGMDLTEDSVQVFLRCSGGVQVLAGRLGGRIMPSQADWSMMKVTREVDAGADGVGTRQTRPALSVTLRKAPDSRHEWEPVIIQEAQCLADQAEAIGALDEDGASRLLELESGEEPNREGWTPQDHATELKAKGDECFRKQRWEPAVDFYTRALGHTPDNEKLLSNRSAAYLEAKQYQAALDDAKRAEEIAPEWPKSFFRQGMALRALRRYDMAISAFSEGKAREPNNASWQKEIDETEEKKAARQAARQRANGGR